MRPRIPAQGDRLEIDYACVHRFEAYGLPVGVVNAQSFCCYRRIHVDEAVTNPSSDRRSELWWPRYGARGHRRGAFGAVHARPWTPRRPQATQARTPMPRTHTRAAGAVRPAHPAQPDVVGTASRRQPAVKRRRFRLLGSVARAGPRHRGAAALARPRRCRRVSCLQRGVAITPRALRTLNGVCCDAFAVGVIGGGACYQLVHADEAVPCSGLGEDSNEV